MRYQQFGDRYVVRLERGEAVSATLQAFLKEHGVGCATVQGIGAVSWARLGFRHPEEPEWDYQGFDGPFEVVSLQGNVSLVDDAPFLHLHTVLGRRDYSIIGGHLVEARVSNTLEVAIETFPVRLARVPEPRTGLTLLDLPERFEPA